MKAESAPARRSALSGTESVPRLQDVTKCSHHGPPWHRRTIEVLRGAFLVLGRGELVGLVGENGSGKSVLMQIVVGLFRRDGGTVDAQARLRYCRNVPLVWDNLTVAEHSQLGLPN